MKKIIAMIPARIGSQRLKYKNLALINNKPLICYVIEAAIQAKIFDEIIINSDDKIFSKIAERYKIKFYLRDKKLGKSNIKSDFVVKDFLLNHESRYLVWLNPIAPLQTSEEIKKIIKFFIKGKYNSLITSNNLKVHSIYKQKPINFKINQIFSKTQDLEPISTLVYSVMMWNRLSFLNNIRKQGYAMMHGKIAFFPVSKESGIIVKNKYDLNLVELIFNARKKNNALKYDNILNINGK